MVIITFRLHMHLEEAFMQNDLQKRNNLVKNMS